jgi:hypothetical protein
MSLASNMNTGRDERKDVTGYLARNVHEIRVK